MDCRFERSCARVAGLGFLAELSVEEWTAWWIRIREVDLSAENGEDKGSILGDVQVPHYPWFNDLDYLVVRE